MLFHIAPASTPLVLPLTWGGSRQLPQGGWTDAGLHKRIATGGCTCLHLTLTGRLDASAMAFMQLATNSG